MGIELLDFVMKSKRVFCKLWRTEFLNILVFRGISKFRISVPLWFLCTVFSTYFNYAVPLAVIIAYLKPCDSPPYFLQWPTLTPPFATHPLFSKLLSNATSSWVNLGVPAVCLLLFRSMDHEGSCWPATDSHKYVIKRFSAVGAFWKLG